MTTGTSVLRKFGPVPWKSGFFGTFLAIRWLHANFSWSLLWYEKIYRPWSTLLHLSSAEKRVWNICLLLGQEEQILLLKRKAESRGKSAYWNRIIFLSSRITTSSSWSARATAKVSTDPRPRPRSVTATTRWGATRCGSTTTGSSSRAHASAGKTTSSSSTARRNNCPS